jgi:sugar lactone lactonase YvrE
MKELKSSIVVDDIIYPEGIRWFGGKIWFSDILHSRVYRFDPQSARKEVVVELPDRPSGLGFLPDGRLLIAVMGERKLLRLDPEGPAVVADLSQLCAMINDMVTDVQGRSYIDAHFDNEAEGGGIIMVEPDGAHRTVARDMQMPNGLAITPDGRTLVVNDLFANEILAFDILENGSLANRRTFADLGEYSPDGLCLDSDGGAWIGLPFQGKFRRILEGGRVTHEINCAGKWGIAPVLGGPGRRTLFLATAEVTLEAMPRLIKDPRNARQECRGWIEAVDDAPAPGAGWP